MLFGVTATQTHDELTTVYGQGVVFISYKLLIGFIDFSSERKSLEDDPRNGRPITAITQQNIDAIKDLMNDDPHISIDYIITILYIVYRMNNCVECLVISQKYNQQQIT